MIGKRAGALTAAVAIGQLLLPATAGATAGAGVIELVSVDGAGAALHKSHEVSMSDDGRFVAFVANSDGLRNLLLRDRLDDTTTEVHPTGAEYPRVSGDGSTVVFRAGTAVLAYDTATATTTQVNVSPTGALPTAGSSSVPGGVSDDGRFVVFRYTDPSYGANGVWLRDRVAGTTTQASNLDPALAPTNFGPGQVSNDGNVVTYSADVFVLGVGRAFQVFAWNRTTGTTTLASVDGAGVAGNRNSFVTDLTPDGRHVAFESGARLSPADPNVGATDVYVRDLQAGTTSFVGANHADDDYPLAGSNHAAVLSDDASLVAFVTTARIAGKWDNEYDVVLADRVAGTMQVVSVDAGSAPAGHVDQQIELSGDGRFVAFASSAIDIVSPFDISECVEYVENEDEDNPWPPYIPTYGECSNAYVVDRAATAGTVSASSGGTVTNGTTSVQVPPGGSGGTVTIAPASASTPVPDGYEVLGEQWVIEAPAATWDVPLRLTFSVDSSYGVAATDIVVIRDGVPIVDCIGATTALPPDTGSADGYPCVTSRATAGDGDAVLTVLTPHASVWSLAEPPPPTTPTVTFASLCEDTQVAAGHKGLAQSLCAKLAAASEARERGDGPSADRLLAAYRSELDAQAGKALSAAAATVLSEDSRLL